MFDDSPVILTPEDIVLAFTKKTPDELALPRRAVIVVSPRDLSLLTKDHRLSALPAWSGFRKLYAAPGKETVVIRTPFGGPGIAALVEELAAFGVREFCLWGYCGGLAPGVSIGDSILAAGAIREDGISHHYLDDKEAVIESDWAGSWKAQADEAHFRTGLIWSCDALYRETRDKVVAYGRRGVLGVEMEVASLYAVCRYRNLQAAAFLVVSDLLAPDGWKGGFGSAQLRSGAHTMAAFVTNQVMV